MKSWSYSHFSAAKSCLQKYKLSVLDKVETAPNVDLTFGSAIHVALDSMFNGEDAEAVFLSYWKAYKDAPMEYGRFSWDDLANLGMNFISRFKRLHFNKYKRWQGETRMYGSYKGMKLEGTADWVGEYMDVPTLVDWKTSASAYDKDRALIATQLHLYAHLLHTTTEHRVKQLMYVPFVKGNGSIQTPVIIPFSEELMTEHLENMLLYTSILDGNHWPKNPESCLMGTRKCSYFNLCWKGSYT